MWHLVTPIMAGGKHKGNLFMGQFLLRDEQPDYEVFRAQAREFAFDEEAYLAALTNAPCVDRQMVELAMSFFAKLAHMISLLSLSNIKLARSVTEQERLVESLRLSEEKSRADEEFLSDVFASIKDGISVLDKDMNIVRVNPAMEKYFSNMPLVGQKCYKVYHYRDTLCSVCPVEHTLKTGEDNLAIRKSRAGGGNGSVIELYSYPLINRNTGELEGAIEYVRDVTERQRAAEALEASEAKYRLLFDNAPLGIMHYDERGIITSFNDKFSEIVGTPRQKLTGFNMPLQMRDDNMRRAVMDSLTGGIGYYEGEYASVTSDKKTQMRAFFRGIFSEDGAFLGGVCIIEDYTEKYLMEQERQASLNFLQTLMDAIPNPVFYKDSQGVYLGCNRAGEAAWGHARQDFIGKSAFDLHPPDLAATYYAKDEDLLSHPGVQVYETSVAQPDGTRREVIFHKATFFNLDGSIGGLIGVELDITERKQAEEALAEKHRELEETAQELEQSRNMLELILESIPVRVFWKDRDLRYLGCNTQFACDAGFHDPRELIGLDDFAMGWLEQADLYRTADREVMESRRPKVNIVEPLDQPRWRDLAENQQGPSVQARRRGLWRPGGL